MSRIVLRVSLLLTMVLSVALLATPCFALQDDFERSYPLQPGGSFELRNVNGTVEIRGWERNEVEIHAVKTTRRKLSDLDRVSIEVSAKPEAIAVVTRYPQDEGVEVAVEYTVHVPHNARIEHVGTVNGTLRISGVDRLNDLHTVNGNVEVYGAAGTVHARTTNGNVRLELAHFREAQEASAETTNGSVLLAVPAETQAQLEARCLNGDFRSELPLALESTLQPREVHGRLGSGGGPIRLRTINGSIRVVVLRTSV